MRTKILGCLLCVLFILTPIHLVESMKNISSDSMLPNTALTSVSGYWTETQKLLASDGERPDNFGWSVSLDDDTVLIGAANDGWGKGSVYVFTNDGMNWTQQTKLFPSESGENDSFGDAVSLDGETALIGAPYDDDYGHNSGSVYVFTKNGDTWAQEAKLLPNDLVGGATFGCSVSLCGDTALIGATNEMNNSLIPGAAYVFIRNGTSWSQQAKLSASDGLDSDYFGFSVSLDGNTAIIGAFGNDDYGLNSGSAYIFRRINNTWVEEQKLVPQDSGDDDYFGWSVAIENDTALIGARSDQQNGLDSGSAYVFTRTGSTWTQQAKLLASDGNIGDEFSWSVALDKNIALISANHYDHWSGSVYLFTRSGTTWTQKAKLLASDGAEMDDFGMSISLDGDTAFIGAHGDDDNLGSVYVFKKESGMSNLEISIKGGLGVNAVITNHGKTKAYGVEWAIQVKGGFLGLINTTENGIIDISPGESRTMKTHLFFGFGTITVDVKAADLKKSVEGKQIFIFCRIK
jgi:FG-GAP repeat